MGSILKEFTGRIKNAYKAHKYPRLLFYHLDSDVTYRDLPDLIQIKVHSLNLVKLLFAQMQSESKAYFSSKRLSQTSTLCPDLSRSFSTTPLVCY